METDSSNCLLQTVSGDGVNLCDHFKSSTAFLICSGPSVRDMDLSCLRSRGILTCSVNNAATVFRSNLWVSYDSPGKFSEVIWRDPAILKFVPIQRLDKPLTSRSTNGHLEPSTDTPREMPATFGFRANRVFRPQHWLTESSINCGDNESDGEALRLPGARSVMLVAVRLLHYLGIRRLFLIGCDFKMRYGAVNYAFEQSRSRRSVKLNNQIYRTLSVRFEQLLPYFEADGFEVFNCTPNSGLQVFPYVEFQDAVHMALGRMPTKADTDGMYDPIEPNEM